MVWWIHDLLRWIWICAIYDVSHLLPQLHSTPPYPTTCTVTSPQTPSNTTTVYHYHTTQARPGDANNTSLILAKCLAEHCASPENGISNRDFLWQNYYHKNGVGVLSLSPYVTELTGKKKAKTIGVGNCPPATPRRCPWLQNVMYAHSFIHSLLHCQHNPYPS